MVAITSNNSQHDDQQQQQQQKQQQQQQETLPVIDIAPLLADVGAGDAAAKQRVASAMRAAALEWGFFYVTGYGADMQARIDAMIAATRRVFDLPAAEKEALAAAKSPLHRGYTGVGGAHNCTSKGGAAPDLKESFLLGAEGDASQMHGDNVWPPAAALPGWREDVRAYFSAALGLSRAVARGLALALALPEGFFEERMRDPVAQLLLLRYPPPPPPPGDGSGGVAAATAAAACAAQGSASAVSGARAGCGEHTDCGFLTVLAQDDVPGLEVRRRPRGGGNGGAGASGSDEGEWLAAPPLPGAVLVNLGDLAEYWSGGAFRSTPHRVTLTDAARRAGRARHSCVFFCNADFGAEVAPLAAAAEGGGADDAAPATAAATTTAGRYICEKLGLMYGDK